LLAEKYHLGLARRTRSEQSDEEPSEHIHEVEHVGTTLPHRCVGATRDEVFGSHTGHATSRARHTRPAYGDRMKKGRSYERPLGLGRLHYA
jgi:hypothetical protein